MHTVARILDLDAGEVFLGVAVHRHTAAGEQAEVRRVGHADQAEAEPVGIVGPVARYRGKEPLRGGVGTDHERHITYTRQDLRSSDGKGRGPRRARCVARGQLAALEAQSVGERGARDPAGIAIADSIGARDELYVVPRHAGIVHGLVRGSNAVLDEVAAPLAPGVHAGTQYCDLVDAHQAAPLCARSHFQTT